MIGAELWTHGEIFVKSWRRKCEDSFAYVSYSSKDIELSNPGALYTILKNVVDTSTS